MRDWRFTLHLQDVLTSEQLDTLFVLDRFCDGRTNLVRGPDTAEFWCTIEAETLTDAIADALSRFEEFPGVLVRSVELDEMALEDNGMATPAVVPVPPPLEAVPPVA
ncbi:hypothetical protein [Streptomyces yaizuensis]|uniref:DUF4911 domain-containing protein n=1 Tax=Streptomyces yaizuensis TaxID=2989713 RepID=A0ABQ5P4I2_9ACTN|nr:hypothetical protein [Streptomyces sp. YSPA8]GLF97484.1 hypothetical protein SYYSPA8_24325 [Streptomyces sp. YSPA8]